MIIAKMHRGQTACFSQDHGAKSTRAQVALEDGVEDRLQGILATTSRTTNRFATIVSQQSSKRLATIVSQHRLATISTTAEAGLIKDRDTVSHLHDV